MAIIRVQFERWFVHEIRDPDDDDDSFVEYFKLNDRWFKVTSYSDFDGYETNMYQRDQDEVDFDPSQMSSAKLEKRFAQNYRVPDDCEDPIAAVAAYKFWYRSTVYAGQTGWPTGVSRIKMSPDDEVKNFLA